jgi:DNA-binding LytR/AlgR family response regulator
MNIKFIKDERMEENLLELRARENSNEILNIIESFQERSSLSINLYDRYNVYKSSVNEIIKFYSESGGVFALIKEKVMRVKLKLYEIDEIYCSHGFIRINNHEIVNINMIDHFDLSKSGLIYVELLNGSKCTISRRRVKDIKKYLGI